MSAAQLQLLKADYLEWTGGFEPEADNDVETYIASSMPSDMDDDEVRKALTEWMHQTAEANKSPR
jgi:hypothetical protein